MLLLCGAGLGILYSAGFNPESGQSAQMRQQFYSMLVGLLAFVVSVLISPAFWKRYAFLFYGLGCFFLVLVLGTGLIAKGAQRWIAIGSFRMQPSEFMKIAVILALARVFSSENSPRDGYTFRALLMPTAVGAIPALLIVLQPDLGTALSVVLISGTMLLFVGIRAKVFVRLLVVALVGAVPAWNLMHEYQRKRILNFMFPELDPLGSGYHAIQSKIAVGSGMVTGKGFLQGTQTQLSFLPEQTTDFIFSVLAEEWGFLGSTIVICLYALTILHALKISARCSDRFSSLVVIGVCGMLFWHVLINISMVIGCAPVVGITLPLLSYGGSSVVTCMIGLGLVGSISMRRYLFA
ncbi:MAG: rod shape-determining protein RodA [Deltaproteobacteria bacterium]|nr:rod shape-determining protein RodA [Deltaproteobacteria bacterium]